MADTVLSLSDFVFDGLAFAGVFFLTFLIGGLMDERDRRRRARSIPPSSRFHGKVVDFKDYCQKKAPETRKEGAA